MCSLTIHRPVVFACSAGSGLKDFLTYVLTAFLLSWSATLRTLEFQELVMFLQRAPTEVGGHG